MRARKTWHAPGTLVLLRQLLFIVGPALHDPEVEDRYAVPARVVQHVPGNLCVEIIGGPVSSLPHAQIRECTVRRSCRGKNVRIS